MHFDEQAVFGCYDRIVRCELFGVVQTTSILQQDCHFRRVNKSFILGANFLLIRPGSCFSQLPAMFAIATAFFDCFGRFVAAGRLQLNNLRIQADGESGPALLSIVGNLTP